MVTSGRAVIDLTLPPEPSSPGKARRAVVDRLGQHVRCGDILVCVSEAVTNAVLHARTAVRLVVWEDGPLVRVEVSDADPSPPLTRTPDLHTPTGRGLRIIDQLATRWGVETRPDGKTLWLEVAG